jgi:cyclophilin family peptidyl-prolyl cis-trans isomerase
MLVFTYAKHPHLDGKYTIIGKVIDGAKDGGTLDAMEAVLAVGVGRGVKCEKV